MSNRNKAAEIIAPWIDKEWGYPEDNAESAASALSDAGLLAPDLPEPDVTSANNTPMWRADGTNMVTVTDGLTPVRMWILDHAECIYTPAAARAQAYALLAAADHAEKEYHNA